MRTALAIPLIDGRRERRVAELLIVVCILSLADLIFTVWAHVVTPRSGSNCPQTLALPQGHESKLGSQISVQIFSPLGSRAQTCPGLERQSASVSQGAQKRRRTQKGSCAPLESESVSQKKPVGQSESAAQLVEQ